MTRQGPLASLRVIEMIGIGPAPLAGQFLADLGAEVIVIDRKSGPASPADISRRNKRSIALNLKSAEGVAACQKLIAGADVVIEGFRPGVMEKLGLGPDEMMAANPKLVYGRMTGWGQTGPWASMAGHDINYISLSGALHMLGPKDAPPTPPLNLFGDYGGGTMFLIMGVLSAIIERQSSGKGQVIDAAMVDGVASLLAMFHSLTAMGLWTENRVNNLVDGGAQFYRCYETKDGKYMAVGPIEPQFYAEFCEKLGMPADPPQVQNDKSQWDALAERIGATFLTKTRDEWAAVFEGSDACVSPVLTLSESEHHPHLAARGVTFRDDSGVLQAAPAPRFDRTPAGAPAAPRAVGGDFQEVLAEAGYSADDIAAMKEAGAIS